MRNEHYTKNVEILGPLNIYGMAKDSNIIFRVSKFLPIDGKRFFFTRKTVLTKIVLAEKNSFCHPNLSSCCINLTLHFLLFRYDVNSFTYFLKNLLYDNSGRLDADTDE